MKTTFSAPLEIASIPNAPVPQKQSITARPFKDILCFDKIEFRVLKIISLALSEVGRIKLFFGPIIFLPLNLPEIILIFKSKRFENFSQIKIFDFKYFSIF